MEKRVLIEVTQEDIDEGIRCSGWRCPIARAASRALGKEIVATGYGLHDSDGKYTALFTLNQRTIDLMGQFDRGGKMNPFSFYAMPITEEE